MLSVALCVAMVITVLSVMSGFLDMVRSAGRVLIGDVVVQGYLEGFPDYDQLLELIRGDEGVEAASATVEGFGLLKMPDGDIHPIPLVGIDGSSFNAVTGYEHTLYWRPLTEEEQRDIDPRDWRGAGNDHLSSDEARKQQILESLAEEGITLKTYDGLPGAVLGIEIYRGNHRLKLHSYDISGIPMPGRDITISVIPITREGGFVQAESRVLKVVNEFSVGRYDIDSSQVFVPFELLQKMLKMQPLSKRGMVKRDNEGRPMLDEFDEPIYETMRKPGRASKILVKGKEGVDPVVLSKEVRGILDDNASSHPSWRSLQVLTWEEQVQDFIGAVKKETALVTTLFSIISLVSVFLVLAIFWTIVQQKTRDIGILRAVGASRLGIMWLFLRYGLIIGIIGAVLGGLIAYSIVWNINPIHEFIGRATGTYIWDPKVYYFNKLPNTVNPVNALIIMGGGMLFAVLGALIPAIRAAFVDPVASLRYE